MSRRTGLFSLGKKQDRRRVRRDVAKLRVESLEVRITPATRIWTGDLSSLWGDAGNWSGGVAPGQNDDLVFPTSAANFVSQNNFGDGQEYNSITIEDPNYNITGSKITLLQGITADFNGRSATYRLDTALGSGVVSVSTTASLDIQAVISGTSGLFFTGGGTLNLGGSSNNTFSGDTTVDSGTLVLSKSEATAIPGDLYIGDADGPASVREDASDQIADTSSLHLTEDGTLDLNGSNETIANLDVSGSKVQTGSGVLTLNGDFTAQTSAQVSHLTGAINLPSGMHTFFVNVQGSSDFDVVVDANLSGSGSLVKTGDGTLFLDGNNGSYSGAIESAQGILQAGSFNALGDAGAGTTVDLGATLQLYGGASFAEPLTLSGNGVNGMGALGNIGSNTETGNINLVGSSTSIGSQLGLLQLSGAIGGGGGSDLVTVGQGTILLDGSSANSYGNTTVHGAGLYLAKNGATSIPHNLRIGDGVTTTFVEEQRGGQIAGHGSVSINHGSFQLADVNDTIVNLTSSNGSIVTGTGILSLNGDIHFADSTSGTDLQGAIDLNESGGTLFIQDGSQPVNFGAVLGGSTSEIDFIGNGNVVDFSASNTFTGSLVLLTGVVVASNDDALGSTAGSTIIIPGATLALRGDVSIDGESLNIGGSGYSGTYGAIESLGGYNHFNGPISLSSDLTVGSRANSTLSFDGVIDDGGGNSGLIFDSDSSGAVVLANANTFSGAVNINSGVVVAENPLSLGSTSGKTTVASGGELRLSNTVLTAETITLSGTGADGQGALKNATGISEITGQVYIAANTTIGVDSGTLILDQGPQDLDTNTLTKVGSATLVLAGSSNVAATVVSAGTLEVVGSLSGPVSVSAGATLVGTGSTGDVTVNGGTISPGITSQGNLQTGNLTLDSESQFAVDLDGNTTGLGSGHFSRVHATGTVNLGDAALSVTIGPDYTPASGDKLVILNNDGSDAVTGTFAGLGEGATYTVGTKQFLITYVGGDGNDVELDFVSSRPTTTTLSADVTPTVFGQTVTITANTSGTGGMPTGTVSFFDGANYLGDRNVDGAGDATFTTSDLGVGTHSITAVYNGDASNFASTSSAMTQTVNTASSTTVVSSLTNPSVFGQPIIIAASVTPVAPGGGYLDGNVTFMEGSTVIGTGSLSGGVATILIAPCVGLHSIYAIYEGNSSYDGSTSSDFSQEVDQGETSTALSSSPDPSVFGQSVTFTATVSASSPSTGTPTGLVLFFDDGTTLIGEGMLDGSGTATFSTSSLPPGSHSITAVYEGDSNYLTSTSSGTSQAVAHASTSTALLTSNDTGVFGQSMTFTATVSASAPGSGLASGTVTFMDGSTVLGSAMLDGSGIATYTMSSLSTSSHSITAVYNGDANFDASTSSATSVEVDQANTTATLTSSDDPSVFGQSVTFTATISAVAPGAGIPSGTVTFMDGSTSLGTGTLDEDGVASLVSSSLVSASHTITAIYSGDTNFAGSASSGMPQDVCQVDTVTTVFSSANPSVFGQSVTFTAFVSPLSPGSGMPTGTVTFMDGSAVLGSGTLDGSGTATFSIGSLTTATHSITAVYAGDSNDNASTSEATSQVINPSGTVTTFSSSITPSVFGQSVTFTASVSASSPGSGLPSGSIAFMDGSTSLGMSAIDGSGNASFTISSLSVRSHTITAVFQGDTNFAASISDPVTQEVDLASTAAILTSSADPGVMGQSVTFTATIVPVTPGSGIPTGDVTFMEGSGVLGSGTLDASGVATFSTSALSVGGHLITAIYSGDSEYLSSLSDATSQIVGQATTTAILSSSSASSVFGQSVTFTATVVTVSPGSGTATGVVTFFDGETFIGTGTLDSSGVATFSTSTFSLASHTITAVYGGDANYFASSTDTSSLFVSQAATTTSVASSGNPGVFGQSVTFTATVAAVSPGSGTSSGTVSFFDGATLLGTAILNGSGIAILSTSSLLVGSHSITASYSGDTNYSAGTPATMSQVVGLASTHTAVSASLESTVLGQSTTITGTVTVDAPSLATATTYVAIYDGSALLGVGSPDSNGQFSIATSQLTVGSHSIYAVSIGDSFETGGTSGTITVVVDRDSSSTQLSSSSPTTTYGDALELSATVTAVSPGTASATGMVSFRDGSTVLGTATLNELGIATFVTTTLSAGTHSLFADYIGDANVVASESVDGISETVGQAVLTVSADSYSRTYGQANPTLTSTITGFQNGETIATSDITGSPDLFSAASPTSPVAGGPYAIIASAGSLESSNYTFAFIDGSLAVDPAILTIHADSVSRSYGDANPALTATFSGFQNGETIATSDITGSPDLFSAASPTSPVAGGPYAIIASVGTLSSGNYSFDLFDAELTVTKAQLAVTADHQSREYGDANPTLTATFSGFKNGETLATSDVTGSPDLATAANPSSPVAGGPYAITAALGSLASSNYTIGTAPGSLAITPATLLFGANDASRAYGGTNPAFTPTFSGFKNGENLATSDVTGSLSLSTSVTPSSPVAGGPYAIIAGVGSLFSTNYVFSASPNAAQLTVTPAPLVVTANDASRVFGAGNPPFSATYSGFRNGETSATSDLTGSPSLTTSATPSSPVASGPYAIDASAGSLSSSNYALSFVNGSLAINQATSTTTLSLSANPTVFGQGVTISAQVASASPSGAIPTGSVTFTDGAATLAVVPLDVSGRASFTTSSLIVGGHTISATYSGSADITAGEQITLVLGVNHATASVSLVDPSSTVFGQSAHLAASVAAVSTGGVPSGTVEFFDGSTSLGIATLDSFGAASLDIASLGVGPHPITAVYSGDARFFSTTTSPSIVQTVSTASTSLSPGTSGASVFGQAVTFTAAISVTGPGAGTPTGVVVFSDGITTLGIAALDATGFAQFTTSVIGIGSHTISASYGGDARFSGSSSTVAHTVGKLTGSVSLRVSSASPVFGQALTLTANVPAGTGSVAFQDGSTILGTATISGEIATLATSALSVGSHAITAIYSGDSTVNSASSTIVSVAVSKSATTEVVIASGGSIVPGQTVSFTASVAPTSPGSGTATGTITFFDGLTSLGSSPLDLTGHATIAISNLTVGTHSISATYSGDGSFSGITSATIAQTVAAAASTTTLNISGGTVSGEAATLTATVAVTSPGSATSTGTVLFLDGSNTIGSAPVSGSGTASITLPGLSVGSHSFTAQYLGDSNIAGSASIAVSPTVARAETSTVILAPGESLVFGGEASFSASVAIVSPGSGAAAGIVTFFDGSAVLGTAALTNGSATFAVKGLAVGTHAISAIYSGDVNSSGSTSIAVLQVIDKAATTAIIATPKTSISGQTLTIVATVQSVDSLAGMPTGNVVFKDGSTTIGTVSISAGSAILNISSLAVGNHSITASYVGDNSFTSSSSSATTISVASAPITTPQPAPTASAIASSNPAASFGSSVTFTAVVATFTDIATGVVTFYDGATPIGSAALNGTGAASLTVNNLSVGGHAISASYTGNGNFSPATAPGITEIIMPAASLTSIVAAGTSIVVNGQAQNFTAIVNSTVPGVPATGSVQFFDGDSLIGTAGVLNGQATITASLFGADQLHSIRAVYSGDAYFTASGSTPVSETVVRAQTQAVVSIIGSDRNSKSLVGRVSVTSPGGGVPTGDVVFTLDGHRSRRVHLVNGQAAIRVPQVNRFSSHTVGLKYLGDANDAPTTSRIPRSVKARGHR
ncbi:MAG: hypothetical protein JWN86_3936 [Planctomycetota bacterium]|nr:hypothetical protein [Planctomycetota bacterium]